MPLQTIYLHQAAPEKPAHGTPCNGCGVCCAAETCPVGIIVFRRRRGPCPALRWMADTSLYRCNLLIEPRQYLRWLPASWTPRLQTFLARRLAAGQGCDSTLAVNED